jgi:hypothetical protein
MGIDSGPLKIGNVQIGNIHIEGGVKPAGTKPPEQTQAGEVVDGAVRELKKDEASSAPVINIPVNGPLNELGNRATEAPVKPRLSPEEVAQKQKEIEAAKIEEQTGQITDLSPKSPKLQKIIDDRNRLIGPAMKYARSLNIDPNNNAAIQQAAMLDFDTCSQIAQAGNPNIKLTDPIQTTIQWGKQDATLTLQKTDRINMSATLIQGDKICGNYTVSDFHGEPRVKTEGIDKIGWPKLFRDGVKSLVRSVDSKIS